MIGFAELIECDEGCRFPLDDTNWCGAKTVDGESWCAKHRARVFLPQERIPRYLRLEKRAPTPIDEVRDTWRRMEGR